jgi:enoyl-CoA hydratase/carnithine racemase
VTDSPLATRALELLLASAQDLDVAAALVAESATYSMLQAGPEHHAWLAARPNTAPPVAGDDPPVLVARDGDVLRLTLNRPHVRNAFNAAMRDALVDALDLPALDESITAVTIDGAGANFSSGGDLTEFGSRPDVVTAHLIRVERSVGRAIHRVRERVTAFVHGPCVGAGVELPAFAGRVVAHPGTTFRLPEVAMGLVPGAGGTVSLPRRIGIERTAWLACSGTAIDAPTALDWGLVDEIDEIDAQGRSDGRSTQ